MFLVFRMNYDIDIDERYRILNDIIEDLPNEYIRQIKINYDAKCISIIILRNLDINKLVFTNLKYDNYEMQDIYYLISKISVILSSKNYKISHFPNYKKDGFNIFINDILYSFYKEDEDIILELLSK